MRSPVPLPPWCGFKSKFVKNGGKIEKSVTEKKRTFCAFGKNVENAQNV